jgi:hypothetical protein
LRCRGAIPLGTKLDRNETGAENERTLREGSTEQRRERKRRKRRELRRKMVYAIRYRST